MTVSELIGIMKLSFRQAEGRRFTFAVLCLKYIVLAVAAAAVLQLLIHSSGEWAVISLYLCSAVTALIAVCIRGMCVRELYQLSEGFLCDGRSENIPSPAIPVLLSGELVYLAVVSAVSFVMLSPAYVCFRFGIHYYSLSADRSGLMLLSAASILLAAGGILFSAVIRARLGCAEYLWLSMQCGDMFSALDCSWEMTRDDCGDILRLRFLSVLFAPGISSLNEMNFSQHLLRQKGKPAPVGIRLEIVRDLRGEQRLELY